jgi:hypothetical protein
MEMDPARRPQNAGELLHALKKYSKALPGYRFSESLDGESAPETSNDSRDRGPSTEHEPRI